MRKFFAVWVLSLCLIPSLAIMMQLSWVVRGGSEDPSLVYQPRRNPDRYEGVKDRPVSGYDLVLISARALYTEPAVQIPAHLRLKFFLKESTPIFITVRELYADPNYWLDNVKPYKPWQEGYANEFEWPTQEVIQRLQNLRIQNLGVVARLNSNMDADEESVAPVLFYHDVAPSLVTGYLFTFIPKVSGEFRCTISKRERPVRVVYNRVIGKKPGRQPFTVEWEDAGNAEGWYRLVLIGRNPDDVTDMSKAVDFYHRPEVE